MNIINKENAAVVLNELLTDLFKHVLYIQEKQLQNDGSSLSVSEIHLLESVERAENNTVTNIAKMMLITKSTFSINASKLIKKGYLIKYRDEEDGRIVRVEITDKAREVLKIHEEYHKILAHKALEDLSYDESVLLNRMLRSVLGHLKKEYQDIFQRI